VPVIVIVARAAAATGQEADVAEPKLSKTPVEGATLRVTYAKSAIGYPQDQKDTIKALGFRRLNQTIERADNAALRGMLHKVKHLINVEEV
jgi:large subunit ribosomal protein L30